MLVSDKISGFMERASWIRKMFEEGNRLKAEFGAENVFDFTLGNPIAEPPESFRKALRELTNDPPPGLHRYMPNAGHPETRAAIAAELKNQSDVPFRGEDVVMSVGAAGGLNVFLKAICNPGDEIIILKPYFVEYLFYIDNHGGVAVEVDTADDFSLDIGAIQAALTSKTRAVFINSPNNPTGRMYSKESLEALAAVLGDHDGDVLLVSDEPYRRIVFDGQTFPSIERAYPLSVIIGSHSKDLALPGERIGYIALSPNIPEESRSNLVAALTFTNRTLGFVNAPSLVQRAVAKVQGQTVPVAYYQERRDLLCGALADAGYEFIRPEGAFYLFPKSPIPDDVEWVRKLQKYRILVVPGSGFGTPGYFRVSYCTSLETIEGALDGFRSAIASL